MNLQEKIKADLLEAVKSRDTLRVSVLRMIQAAIKNKAIDLREKDLTDEIVMEVVAKQAKQRKEAIGEYEKGGRLELAATEKKELGIIENYLPKQLSDKEIEKAVKTAMDKINAKKDDFGKVMGIVAKELKGKADGYRIRQMVENLLK